MDTQVNGLHSLGSLQRKNYTASSLTNIFPTMTAPMHKKSWRSSCVATWGNYQDLYLLTDILSSWQVSLGPSRKHALGSMIWILSPYCIRPNLDWDALPKKTGLDLDLLTDYDQHLFTEKRGGQRHFHTLKKCPTSRGLKPSQFKQVVYPRP